MSKNINQKAENVLSYIEKLKKINKYIYPIIFVNFLLFFLIIFLKKFSILTINTAEIFIGVLLIINILLVIIHLTYNIIEEQLDIKDFLIYSSQNKENQEKIIKLLKNQKKSDVLNNINYIDQFMEDKEWFFKYIEIKDKYEILKNEQFINYSKKIDIAVLNKYFENEMDLIKIKSDEYKEFLSILNTEEKKLLIINI